MLIKIIILLILVALSGFFSGAETAFMSLGKFKYKEYIRKKRKHYLVVQSLKENPHKLISTILICNNLVNIAAASLATLYGAEFFLEKGWQLSGAAAAGIVTGVLTLVILIFGEIIPKTYANLHYAKVVSNSARTIYVLSILFTPIIYLFDIITKITMKGKVSSKNEEKITEEEIKTIVSVGSEEGGIDTYERQLIHKIFQFDDKIVKEIMTPRMKVFSLDADAKIQTVIKDIIEEGHSRVPVYKENNDNIIGIFHIRDMLDLIGKKNLDKKLKTLSTKPLFVPESKPIDDLFKEMQKKKIQMSIVVDEFGGLAGVVTMEDLLEEIVGEIYDEDDERVRLIRKVGPREYLVNGESTLREVKEACKIKVDALESETIGSYILTKLEKIPEKGEEIKMKKGKITVEKVTDKSIEQVRVKV